MTPPGSIVLFRGNDRRGTLEKYIWRLLTAIFMLLVAAVLGIFAFLFQGAALMLGICFYGAVFCALIGVAKGLLVMVDYHREHKEE